MLESLKARHKRSRWHVVVATGTCLAVWGFNLAGAIDWPSDRFWLNMFDAFACVLIVISMWSTWRIHRRLGLQMTGRVFTLVAEPFGLIVVEGPVKEGRDWKVTQWRTVGFLNLAGQLFEPKGRGSTMSRALFNLWVVLDPRMGTVPEAKVEEFVEKLENDLQKNFVPPVGDSPEDRVQ